MSVIVIDVVMWMWMRGCSIDAPRRAAGMCVPHPHTAHWPCDLCGVFAYLLSHRTLCVHGQVRKFAPPGPGGCRCAEPAALFLDRASLGLRILSNFLTGRLERLWMARIGSVDETKPKSRPGPDAVESGGTDGRAGSMTECVRNVLGGMARKNSPMSPLFMLCGAPHARAPAASSQDLWNAS